MSGRFSQYLLIDEKNPADYERHPRVFFSSFLNLTKTAILGTTTKKVAACKHERDGETTRRPNLLILTRKIGETIAIGDDIKVQVIEIKGKQVRLGIEAPNDTSVHREEIYLRIQDQNRMAAAMAPADLSAAVELWASKIQKQER